MQGSVRLAYIISATIPLLMLCLALLVYLTDSKNFQLTVYLAWFLLLINGVVNIAIALFHPKMGFPFALTCMPLCLVVFIFSHQVMLINSQDKARAPATTTKATVNQYLAKPEQCRVCETEQD
jgi:hypothetical protein